MWRSRLDVLAARPSLAGRPLTRTIELTGRPRFVGLVRGLLATIGGLLGLAVGGIAAFWAVPVVNDALPTAEWRGPATIALAVVLPLGRCSG
jgi:type IV secretory pathway TrbD component